VILKNIYHFFVVMIVKSWILGCTYRFGCGLAATTFW